MRFSKVLIDQAEARIGKGRAGYFLNAEAWYGGNINKLWLKKEENEIEGERGGRDPEQAEVAGLVEPGDQYPGSIYRPVSVSMPTMVQTALATGPGCPGAGALLVGSGWGRILVQQGRGNRPRRGRT